jgi:hypothetical protein
MKSPTVTRMPSLGTVGVPSRCFAPQSAGKRKLPTRIHATGRPRWKPGLTEPAPPRGTGTRSTPSVTLRCPIPPLLAKGGGLIDAGRVVPPPPPPGAKCHINEAPTRAAAIPTARMNRRLPCRRRASTGCGLCWRIPSSVEGIIPLTGTRQTPWEVPFDKNACGRAAAARVRPAPGAASTHRFVVLPRSRRGSD